MKSQKPVLVTEPFPHTVQITIARPETRNAINFAVMSRLEELVVALADDDSVRLVIVRGEGTKSFISGGDLREFHTITDQEDAADMAERMHRILEQFETLPCWTVALLNGDAFGGGCEIASAMDFRVAVAGVKLGFTQGKFYLPPGWGGFTRLQQLVGRANANWLLATTAVIGAEEAEQLGFVQQVAKADATDDELKSLADKLTRNDRRYIDHLKRLSRVEGSRDERLRGEISPFSSFWSDPQHLDRVEQFLARKKGP